MSLKLHHPNNPVFNSGASKSRNQFMVTSSMMGGELARTADEAILLARAANWDSWINSEPLLISHLDEEENEAYLFFISEHINQKIVLIDFFDYTVLHCHRGLKYVRAWHERYKAAGLVVIGVHSPMFSFAKDKKALMDAANSYNIDWPLVLDNDFALWKTVNNTGWPRRVLLDANRAVIQDVTQEGHYDVFEKMIQDQLRKLSPGLACPLLLKAMVEPDPKGTEIFLGLNYSLRIANSKKPVTPLEEIQYENSPEMKTQGWLKTLHLPCLEGRWTFRDESIHPSLSMIVPYLGEFSVNVRFDARDVFIVAGAKSKNSMETPKPVKVQVMLNERPIIEDHFGADLSYSESRRTQIVMKDARLFHLLTNLSGGPQELKLIIDNEVYDTAEFFAIYFSG